MSSHDRVTINGDRHYRVDGNTLPSVTTITSTYPPKQEALAAANVPPEYVEYAAMRGTIVHHRILSNYSNQQLPPPKLDHSVIQAADRSLTDLETEVETCVAMWENNLDYEIGDRAYIEQRISNTTHGYAGTLDCYSDRRVMDLKTSKDAFDSHKLQIAAYTKAIEESPRYSDPRGADIVVLHPGPSELKAEIHSLDGDEIEYWFGEFEALIDAYNR